MVNKDHSTNRSDSRILMNSDSPIEGASKVCCGESHPRESLAPQRRALLSSLSGFGLSEREHCDDGPSHRRVAAARV